MPIYERQGLYHIEHVKGSHKTYEGALKQLQAVKAEQARRRKGIKKRVYKHYKRGRKRGGQHYNVVR